MERAKNSQTIERKIASIETLLRQIKTDILVLQNIRNADTITVNEEIIIRETDMVKDKNHVTVSEKLFEAPIQRLRFGRFLFTCQKCGFQWMSTRKPKRCQNPKSRHTKWWKQNDDDE